MYIFEAHYIHMSTGEETIRKIKFNGQFLDSERDCYLYAMGRAFDMTEVNETLTSVEFIAC